MLNLVAEVFKSKGSLCLDKFSYSFLFLFLFFSILSVSLAERLEYVNVSREKESRHNCTSLFFLKLLRNCLCVSLSYYSLCVAVLFCAFHFTSCHLQNILYVRVSFDINIMLQMFSTFRCVIMHGISTADSQISNLKTVEIKLWDFFQKLLPFKKLLYKTLYPDRLDSGVSFYVLQLWLLLSKFKHGKVKTESTQVWRPDIVLYYFGINFVWWKKNRH